MLIEKKLFVGRDEIKEMIERKMGVSIISFKFSSKGFIGIVEEKNGQ